nr:hypothetical protein [Akkermansia muciniphila]
MPARFFLPARLPLCAGLLYLALPLLLFLLGWVHPAFSVPLCAALACGCTPALGIFRHKGFR